MENGVIELFILKLLVVKLLLKRLFHVALNIQNRSFNLVVFELHLLDDIL